MKVGTSLTISIGQGEDMNIYRCKLIDLKDDNWIIDYPLSSNPENVIALYRNTKISVDFIDKGNVFTFESVVKDIQHKPIHSFVIPAPKEEQLNKIQRREFVRIDTDTDVAVYSEDHSFSPFVTVTQDISGGGAAIIVPKNINLDDNSPLKLYLVLRSPYSQYEYIEMPAEVVRTMTRNEVKTASLRFLIDDRNKQQKIIKYCFEIQRQAIQQNMLLT